MKSSAVIHEIKSIIRKDAPRFKLIIDDLQQPYDIDPDHPFVKTYLATAKKMGIASSLKGSEGATVITFFKKQKIPAFATGYGSSGTAHTTDEYCEINKLFKGAKLLEQFLKDYDNR